MAGYLFYQGESQLTGADILGIITLSSRNGKTGNAAQTWILYANQAPHEAQASGADMSVCGDCPLRPHYKNRGHLIAPDVPAELRGSCYVKTFQAPNMVYRAHHKGRYPQIDSRGLSKLASKVLRIGSYGDPAAIPFVCWHILASNSRRHIGYTHQWRNPIASPLQRYCMASVNSAHEALEAQGLGWRTFRVRHIDQWALENEVICPASNEAGNRVTCEQCCLCDGNRRPKKSVVIVGHGARVPRAWKTKSRAVQLRLPGS